MVHVQGSGCRQGVLELEAVCLMPAGLFLLEVVRMVKRQGEECSNMDRITRFKSNNRRREATNSALSLPMTWNLCLDAKPKLNPSVLAGRC